MNYRSIKSNSDNAKHTLPRKKLLRGRFAASSQMASIHTATMTFARRLAHVETIQQQDSAERALNKLARTYAMQMEALKRYRTGGEQKVTVQHVSVNEGGQAIVGNVNQAAGGTPRKSPLPRRRR